MESPVSVPSAPPFRLFGPDHLAALAAVVGACGLVWSLRGRMGPGGARWLGRLLACGLGIHVVGSYAATWSSGNLSLDQALPLHLCNVLVLLTLVALVRPTPGRSEIVYYWGVGGSVQALLTPDLARGFPSWDFVLFFSGHGLLVVAPTYLVGVLGLEPRPGGAFRAFRALLGYAAAVGLLDAAFGWNYGYLCEKPRGTSLLDHLGPWPVYVAAGLLLGLASFWLLSFPWRPRPARSSSR